MTQELQQEQRVSTTMAPHLHIEVKKILAVQRGLTMIQVVDDALSDWVKNHVAAAAPSLQETTVAAKG